jgi:hypothetical protein
MHKRTWLLGLTVVIAAFPVYRLATKNPIIANTPGEWDCACGDWYIKTTRLVLWNPLRDRTPERAAESFLSNIRANNCNVNPELCESILPSQRVSNWELAYREDADSHVVLYFKLTKYGSSPASELRGIGTMTIERRATEWAVTGYDSYF